MTEPIRQEKPPAPPESESDRSNLWRGWVTGVIRPLNFAAMIAAVIMLILLVIAFCEIIGGIGEYLVLRTSGEGQGLARMGVMKTTLKSFELMLLAPLPFLMILGLAQYLRAVTGQAAGGKGRLLITEAKALWIGLLIGVFATDLLEKALSEGIHYEASISTAIIVALLMVFFFGLEKITHRQRTD